MENQETVVATSTENGQQQTEQQPNVLADHFWNETPIQQTQNSNEGQENKKEEAQTPPLQNESNEEIVDTKDWLKRELDVEDISIVKGWKEELKTLKEKEATSELKFANDESKKWFELLKEGKLDDVYEIVSKQKNIDRILSLEVNENSAADIVKFGMKNKYKDLSDAQIDYKFNKQFGLPKEPTFNEDVETEQEFKGRHEAWKDSVRDIKMDLEIEAKTLRPDIEKLKAELVLPEIPNQNQNSQKPLTQEDLAAIQKANDDFLESTKTFLKDFAGFKIPVKENDFSYEINYIPSQEQKQDLQGKFDSFVKANYDANELFADRWLNQDGKTINIEQVAKDLQRLYYSDAMDSKIATDSANKRLEAYLKEKKNVDVTKVPQGSPSIEKSHSEKLQEQFWG